MDELKEAPNNPFDAPVPGQSLTDKPGSAAWEHPPQYTNTAEAADFVWSQLSTPEFAEQVIAMLDAGIPVEAIGRVILFGGFTEGKWTPDIIALLLEPVMYLIILMAEEAGIEYIIDAEGAREEQNVSDKELGRRAKEEISMFDKMIEQVLAEGINPASVPPELVAKISEKVPSILEQTVDEQSLLRRSNDG